MVGMNVQPTIAALNAEIAKLTKARDALQALTKTPAPVRAKAAKKAALSADEAKRAKWAEAKRKSRAKKKGTK